MLSLIFSCLNLLLLILFLFFRFRKTCLHYIVNRRVLFLEELRKAQEQLDESKKQDLEVTSRLNAINSEILKLQNQMREDVESYDRKMMIETQSLIQRRIDSAHKISLQVFREFKKELYLTLTDQMLDQTSSLLGNALTLEVRKKIEKSTLKELRGLGGFLQ